MGSRAKSFEENISSAQRIISNENGGVPPAWYLVQAESHSLPTVLLSSSVGLQRSRPGILGREENDAATELYGSLCTFPVLIPIPI